MTALAMSVPESSRRATTLTPERTRRVLQAVHEARARHPELRQPLNGPRLALVLQRERINVVFRSISAKAYVFGADGVYIIVANSALRGREQVRVVAHEYGHIRLHVDRDEITRQLEPCTPGDPREAEAEMFASALMLGGAAPCARI